MAQLTFNSFRGKSSALCMVKKSQFEFSGSPVYVPASAWNVDAKKGDTMEIPDGFKLVPFVDATTGEIRKTKDGVELKVLAY